MKNGGQRPGDEVAQAYFRHPHSAVPQPNLALCGFRRIHLARGETANVKLEIPVERFHYWDTTKKEYAVDPGNYELLVGAASDDLRLRVSAKIAKAPPRETAN